MSVSSPDRDDVVEYRLRWARWAHDHGWALLPLRGKIPLRDNWVAAPRPNLDQVEAWARANNLGLRCGSISGVFVVDVDLADIDIESEILRDEVVQALPRTVTAISGGGGRHYLFRAPDPCPSNSASKLAPKIDTRGHGGQIVFAGSVHPETGRMYQWAPGCAPDEVELAALPEEVLARLQRSTPRRPVSEPPPAAPVGAMSRYATAALTRECSRVAGAARGERNHTLNRAAYSLGQLIGGGVLLEADVTVALLGAAHQCGLISEDGEQAARATILSGLKSGMATPRAPVLRPVSRAARSHSPPDAGAPTTPGPATDPTDDTARDEVLIPGGHVDDAGQYHEVGQHDFVDAVLASLPAGVLYWRGDSAGELVGHPGARLFRVLTSDRARVLIDRHVRLVQWKLKQQDGQRRPVKLFVPCSRDLAGVIIGSAPGHSAVRELRMLTSYPVFLGDDFTLASPGYNAAHGAYYDEPPELAQLDTAMSHQRIRALLEDLTVDFPWREPASRENFFALLLTPLVRPALGSNTPLFLVQSSIPRTGKTKLIEQVLGRVVTGRPTPATQLSDREEEMDKRILAMLLGGQTILHVDNVGQFLDSPALASLLTSHDYSGRVLGRSEQVSVPNTMTIVAGGNNVRATREIVKRTVPIALQPRSDEPEMRTDFRHPDLVSYLTETRVEMLGALVSAVLRWRDTGRESHPIMLGGFERWSQVVGGILIQIGLGQFLDNARAWQRAADPETADLHALVDAWWQRHGSTGVQASQLATMADELGLYQHVMRATSERGRQTAFAMRVLAKLVDVPVGRWVVRQVTQGNNRFYTLECA